MSSMLKIPDDIGDYFEYDKITGILKRKFHHKCTSKAIKRNGITYKKKGYLLFRFRGKYYRVHRVVWFMIYGTQPKSIDHINGIRDDNRIDNLRSCTTSQNKMNTKSYANNTSGHKGVYFLGEKHKNKWIVKIGVKGKSIYIGIYNCIEEAAKARKLAEKKYFKEWAYND